MNKVIIIGGGASGLMAATHLAKTTTDILILEKQNRLGKKILATGNGRCNLTNIIMSRENFHTNYQGNKYIPIEKYSYNETIDTFKELGIIPLIENNKVYPLSEQASSVLDVLRLETKHLNSLTEITVTDINYKNNQFIVSTIDLDNKQSIYKAEIIIVATGGLAGVKEDYSMYNILKKLGHTIEPLTPTLVHILSNTTYCKMMQGTRIKANASIYKNNTLVRTEYGEILFTEDGLSGPAIFQLSRIASIAKLNKENCYITLDLCKNLSVNDIITLIYDRMYRRDILEEIFIGWLNKKVAISIIKACSNLKPTTLVENLEYKDILSLATNLKELRFEVNGTRGFKFAQSTIGGISLEDINLNTMESKIIKNLYITGEILDIDGDCGGYNLQWAWSTGYVAAQNIVRKIR